MNVLAVDLALLLLKGLLIFVCTNVDDLLLLIIFLRESDSIVSRKKIIMSQYLSFIIIMTLSILGSFGKFILPVRMIGLLGLVPILYGIRKLFLKKPFRKIGPHMTTFTMAAFALGDGLDNISAYTTLFAGETPLHICILTSYFFILLTIWYFIASFLAHLYIIRIFMNVIQYLIPFIYILLGIYIICENKAFTLFSEIVGH